MAYFSAYSKNLLLLVQCRGCHVSPQIKLAFLIVKYIVNRILFLAVSRSYINMS